MTGLVLCGGQSRRMGADKGLLKNKDAISWAQLACDKLHLFCETVYVSVNPAQTDYAALFPKNRLIKDDAALSVKGPLLGMLSAFKQLPEEDIFVLACDIVDMTTDLLSDLYNFYKPDSGDIFIYRNRNFPEPLCGIHTRQALAYMDHFTERPGNTNYSIRFFLAKLNVVYLDIPEEQQQCFMNHNYPVH